MLILSLVLVGCNQLEIPFLNSADEDTKTESKDPVTSDEELPPKDEHKEQNKNADQNNKPENDNKLENEQNKPSLEDTTKVVDGQAIITNPDDILVLVNKKRNLPSDYIPDDLVIPNVPFPFVEDVPKKQLRKVAADALENLFEAAESEGLELLAQSGYRSYARQDAIFAYNVQQKGEVEANKVSAYPGQSEHQTGLAMDVTSNEVNGLVVSFGDTVEGIWLAENAANFGFIIRYPEGKEEITGYQYEPWHLRYVGKEVATEIYRQKITLEEYFLD